MSDAPRRVLVTGASGNIGVRAVEQLRADPAVELVVGLSRRRPDRLPPDVLWRELDLTPRPDDAGPDPLDDVLRGIDTVVHLAWLVQPSRDPARLWAANVGGTDRLLRAAERAGVDHVVHASSVGAYRPRLDADQVVDEAWPTDGVATSPYGLAKAYAERLLDLLEERSEVRVVRLRPALVLQRDAAAHVRRLFLGAFVPDAVFAGGRVPVVPDVPGLRFQVVHAEDVADAVRRAVVTPVRGAFNLAAPGRLTLADVAEELGARTVRVPPRWARGAVQATGALRLHPVDVGWFDLAMRTPLLDAGRAVTELGWHPDWSGRATLADLLAGLAEGAGEATPPLEGDAERSRLHEVAETRQGGGDAP